MNSSFACRAAIRKSLAVALVSGIIVTGCAGKGREVYFTREGMYSGKGIVAKYEKGEIVGAWEGNRELTPEEIKALDQSTLTDRDKNSKTIDRIIKGVSLLLP